jgi:hypothetical protein
MKYAMN